MKKTLILLIISIIPAFASGQIIAGGESGHDKVDSSKIKPWISNQFKDYQLVYHFGFSSGESYLFIIIANDSCYAQIRDYKWRKINQLQSYFPNYETFKNVRIQGNKFYSDKTNGEFVIYNWDNKEKKGLIVFKPWTGSAKNTESEFGFTDVSNKVDLYYSGRFPYTSYRLLYKDEIEKLSLSDLQIMSNEIYARYGYIFKPDSDMDIYFKSQKWYKGLYDDVTNYLTGLEKRNVSLIQTVEKMKNGL